MSIHQPTRIPLALRRALLHVSDENLHLLLRACKKHFTSSASMRRVKPVDDAALDELVRRENKWDFWKRYRVRLLDGSRFSETRGAIIKIGEAMLISVLEWAADTFPCAYVREQDADGAIVVVTLDGSFARYMTDRQVAEFKRERARATRRTSPEDYRRMVELDRSRAGSDEESLSC